MMRVRSLAQPRQKNEARTWPALRLKAPGIFGSVAGARIGLDVLPRRITIVAVALREIIAGLRRSRCADNRAGGAADDRAGRGARRPAGQETAEQAADN